MKNLIKILSLLLILSAVTFTACNKQELFETETNLENQTKLPFPSSEYTYEQVIENEHDLDDYELNKSLYSLTEFLSKDFTIDNSIAEEILQIAREANGEVSFNKVFEKFPELSKKLKERADFWWVENSYKYKEDLYKSVLTIPNYENVNNMNEFVLAVGTDIEDDEKNGNHDIIHGWAMKDAKNIGAVKVGEKDAMESNVAVVVLTQEDLNERKNLVVEKVFSIPSNNIKQRAVGFDNYDVKTIKINHRFDKSRFSEVYCTGWRFEDVLGMGNVRTSLKSGNINTEEKWELAEIHRNDIGSIETINADFINNADRNGPLNYTVIFNTYERDWYSTNKSLGNGIDPTSNIGFAMAGKRKHTSEWYTFNNLPSNIESNIKWKSTYDNRTVTFDSSKGECKIMGTN